MGQRIVILGAGFGGLFTARELGRRFRGGTGSEILLLDSRNFHLFSPLLHEVTSGGVEPRHVAWPVRALSDTGRFAFERRTVRSIDLEQKTVLTLEMFERAVIERDPERRRRLLNFVLVGAGCTGVELATELHDLARRTLVRHYMGLDSREVRIVLAEATGRIIPCVSQRLADLGLDKLWRSVFLAKLSGWKNRIRVALDWLVGAFFEKDLAKLEW